MEVRFEKASLDDVDKIVLMQKDLNMLLDLYDLDEERFKNIIQSEIVSSDKAYFVAKVDSETIGVVSVDFGESFGIDDIDCSATISLIYVDRRYRKGKIAYNLLKLAIDEIQNRGESVLVMSVEDNNPNKFLHFSMADIIIQENEERTKNGATTQYLLAVTDINKIATSSFKEFMKNVLETKKNFTEVLKNMPRAETLAYLF